MADRTLGIENMAVSSDPSASQHNLRDNGKDENDLRGTQSNPKMEAPKKRTTFKITSVTKSSQRGGSGDLTQDNDMDSQDDLDETVDSHTEDLSSEIYDTSSKATDIDNQDPLLTPEEVMIKEKPGRFKVVKIETKEPFRRGRWICYDYLDAPERVEIKQDEIPVNSGSSSAANSVHYVHGVDDPSKNPLLAGATGTLSSQLQAISVPDGITSVKTQIEMFQPIQPAPSSQPGVTPVSQVNPSFSNHIAQSSTPYIVQAGVPDHLIGHSLPASNNPSLKSGGSIPNLPPSQHSQNQASLSSSGNIPCSSQQLPTQQGSTIPPGVHSQSASVACSVTVSQQTPPGAMQTGDYVNSASQVGACQNQHIPASHPQQGIYDMSSQQSAYSLNAGTAGSACGMGNNVSNRIPQQNHLSTPAVAQLLDGHGGPDIDAQPSHSSSIVAVNSERGEEATANLGLLPPLEIAVGGISSGPTDDDITEEAFLEYFSNLSTYDTSNLFPPLLDESGFPQSANQFPFAGRRPSLRTQVRNHIGIVDSGSSTVAIDNKIEQAMDLVKSHLMYAVREEVEVLKEQIKELMERMRTIEYENKVLRSDASPETLAKLPPPLPPLQNPLLQQFMSVQQPPSSSS